jgi:hypothetical protein
MTAVVAEIPIYVHIGALGFASALAAYGLRKMVNDEKKRFVKEAMGFSPDKRLQYFKLQSENLTLENDFFERRALRNASKEVLDEGERMEFLNYMYGSKNDKSFLTDHNHG